LTAAASESGRDENLRRLHVVMDLMPALGLRGS
jgi:hypothetical protein